MKDLEIKNILADFEGVPRGQKIYLYDTGEMFPVLKMLEDKHNIKVMLDSFGSGLTVAVEKDGKELEKKFTREFTYEIARLSAKYIKEYKL